MRRSTSSEITKQRQQRRSESPRKQPADPLAHAQPAEVVAHRAVRHPHSLASVVPLAACHLLPGAPHATASTPIPPAGRSAVRPQRCQATGTRNSPAPNAPGAHCPRRRMRNAAAIMRSCDDQSIPTDSAARLRLCLTRPAAAANRSSLVSFFCLLSGRGDVKLLQNKDTKLVRVLLRQEKTLKLCMNHKGQATQPRATAAGCWPPLSIAFSGSCRVR